MSQKNKTEGPSSATKTVNTIAVLAVIAALVFCGVKLADGIGPDSRTKSIAESNMPTGGLEFRNAEEAAADRPEEELLAESVSDSIVIITGGGESSIGAVIAGKGYVITDLESADTAEDSRGQQHMLINREEISEGLYLFMMEDYEGSVPLSIRELKETEKIYAFSPAANGFMLKGYDAENAGDYIETGDRLPDGFCVLIGSDGELIAAGRSLTLEDGRTAVGNNTRSLKALANSKDNGEL